MAKTTSTDCCKPGTANNGNVASITNGRDNTRSQNFTYDALNRIATAQTQTANVTIPNANCAHL